MHERYLGDSFDILKKHWADLLSPIAPMFAHPRWLPNDVTDRFTRLTGISVLNDRIDRNYSLLIDPHTGIPLPDAVDQRIRISHAPLNYIRSLFDDARLDFVVCFDQSTDRLNDIPIEDQRDLKREWLGSNGICSFYYVSHAPFLFAGTNCDTIAAVRQRLIDSGIPETTSAGTRIQAIHNAAT
jgi:hypothetical protein